MSEEIKANEEKLKDGTYSLRIGNEVPEGDVNLAYVYTPRLDDEENIAIINTSSTFSNTIPYEQKTSLVAPDHTGKLSYVELHGGIDSIKEKQPVDIFPSKNVSITRMFKNNIHHPSEALFYKFEIKYHYDSKKGEPNKVVKYTGDQIMLTDENGNPVHDRIKHDIYVMAMEYNPHIYWVKIYLKESTNDIETLKIRYNHIDEVVSDNYAQVTQEELELYVNAENKINIYGKTKQLVQSGKLRIVNRTSAYELVDQETFENSDPNDEWYYAEEDLINDGYKLFVTQKSEFDPRPKRLFNYQIVARYKDKEGKEHKVSTGYINDWVVSPESLLPHERYEYNKEWKSIGMPYDTYKLNARDMIYASLPLGTPSIPAEATYEILDAEGNLLYSTVDAPDNPNVETAIQDHQNNFASAKAIGLETDPWTNARHPNTHIKSLPIDHTVSVFLERQKTSWSFDFFVTGKGVVGTPSVYTGNWWVCADVGIYKRLTRTPLDLVKRNNWNTLSGSASDWRIKIGSNGMNYIENLKDDINVAGIYPKVGPNNENMQNVKDYEFSVRVNTKDIGDDDVIGLLFRVKDSKNYYMFAWEREDILTDDFYYSEEDYPNDASNKPEMTPGSRIIFEEGGCTAFKYDQNIEYSNPKTDYEKYIFDRLEDYMNHGFGQNKKRIYKATPRPSGVSKATGYDESVSDKTGVSFTEITEKDQLYHSETGMKGWEPNKEYKLTVVVAGSNFKIYLNDNPYSQDRGYLICEANDSTHKTGGPGVFTVSQKWTEWSNFIFNEIEVSQVCTEYMPITFYNKEEIRVSRDRVGPLLKNSIEKYAREKYGNTNYAVFSYTPYSDKPDIFVEIDEKGEGFVWAYTTNDAAGGVLQEEWRTSDNGMDVYGSGHVHYHPDGHFTITVDPPVLPNDRIPSYVDNFKWENPVVTKGEGIHITIEEDGKTLKVTADKPEIKVIGKPVVFTPDPIHKSEGVKEIASLNEILEKINLPENIPVREMMLRIERGEQSESGFINQEHRVNYRFRVEDDGLIKYPVDQFIDQLGVNRLRLEQLFDQYKAVDYKIDYEVLVPVRKTTSMQKLFAQNAEGAVMLEKEVGDAGWQIQNGVLVDNNNKSAFVGSYNLQHLNLTDYAVDFTFRVKNLDDDLIGVLFRVQDRNNFYIYAIEGDDIRTSSNAARMDNVQPAPLYDWRMVNIKSAKSNKDYVENLGWGLYHQRVYQVKNGRKRLVAQRSMVTNKGHVRNWYNNIRVESTGNITNLYFQTGVIDEEDWVRAYQIETEWDKGGFGVFNYSQPVEFISIEMTEFETVTGSIENLNHIGRPNAIVHESTKEFCHPHVVSRLKSLGYTGNEKYVPIKYVGTVTGIGEVSVARNGEGPIQVISEVDVSQPIGEVDLVAWTHYEELEATPVFAINIQEERKIDIEKTKVEKENLEIENWYPRIKNGKFQKTIELPYYEPEERTPAIYKAYPVLKQYAPKDVDEVEIVTLQYGIPEYSNQEFYEKKTKLVDKEKPIILNEFAIQTKHTPIVLSSSNQISYVEVEAFRNNKTRKLRVKDIDAIKGIIYLIDRIREEDDVIVRYAYKEEWYEYRGFQKGNEFFHLDLNPSPGHTHTVAYDGFFEWIPYDKETKNYQIKEAPSNELLVKPIHIYLRPMHIKDKHGNIIPGTQTNQTVFHTTEEHWFNEKDYLYDPTMFRLGKIVVQKNSNIEDSVVLDTRTRGGGLDEAISRKIIEKVNKESLHHWDIGYFDGEAYQENGVIIIRLPKTILKSEDNPNGFTEAEVKEAVRKHKAYGVLPIIEYYDPEEIEKKKLNIDTNNSEVFEI